METLEDSLYLLGIQWSFYIYFQGKMSQCEAEI